MGLTGDLEKPQPTSAPSPPGYIAIPASLVRAWGECQCDLFRMVSWSSQPQLLCAANHPLSSAELQVLASEEVVSLYVQDCDQLRLQDDLYAHLDSIVECEDIPVRDRYTVVKDVVAAEMKKVFDAINLDGSIDRIHNMGQKISQLAFSSSIVPGELLAIAMHDTNTFRHLVNVSTYATLLAKHLGIVDKSELQEIATGGLLHDVGKRFMPRHLLHKTTAFDDQDRQLIRQHPIKGFVELHSCGTVSFGQRMMVYQHHEWMNGQGYPVGITGKEIHPWARICAIVDVFEALTGRRYYRNPDPLSKALEIMSDEAGMHFDEEFLQCWKSVME
jgi:putative nucleotidyltransferase with HDIG domain